MSENPNLCKSEFIRYGWYKAIGFFIFFVATWAFFESRGTTAVIAAIWQAIGFILFCTGSIVKRLNYICDNMPEKSEKENKQAKQLNDS